MNLNLLTIQRGLCANPDSLTRLQFDSAAQATFQALLPEDLLRALVVEERGFTYMTNADRDRITVAANKFRAELAALQECDRRLWTDPDKTRGSVIDKSPIDKAHERRKITHL